MKRRKWTGTEKLQIVLEGLRGQVPLGELCARHQLSQSQYYQWRDQLLNHGSRVFDRGGAEQTEQRLRTELAEANLKLSERKLVERAKGILMKARGMDEEQAFQALRRMAMDRGKRLVDIARQVIDMADLLA